MYVVIGAEHCRRQLSQWQFTQAWTGVSISNLTAPHKQRPRIIDLLGNIPSFEARAVRVAAKYVSKVNTGDSFGHQFLFCILSCVSNHDCTLRVITLIRMAANSASDQKRTFKPSHLDYFQFLARFIASEKRCFNSGLNGASGVISARGAGSGGNVFTPAPRIAMRAVPRPVSSGDS